MFRQTSLLTAGVKAGVNFTLLDLFLAHPICCLCTIFLLLLP